MPWAFALGRLCFQGRHFCRASCACNVLKTEAHGLQMPKLEVIRSTEEGITVGSRGGGAWLLSGEAHQFGSARDVLAAPGTQSPCFVHGVGTEQPFHRSSLLSRFLRLVHAMGSRQG